MIEHPTDAVENMPKRRDLHVRLVGGLSFGLTAVALSPLGSAETPTPPIGFAVDDGIPSSDGLGFQNVAPSTELGFQQVPQAPASDGINQPVIPTTSLDPLAAAEAEAAMFPESVELPPEEAPVPPDDSTPVIDISQGRQWTSLQSLPGFGNNGDPWNSGGFAAPPGAVGGRGSGFSGNFNGMQRFQDLSDDVFDGLGFSVSLTGTYDTNPSQGYATSVNSGEGDFFATLGGSAAYRSKASEWTFGLNYSGSYSEYFSQSELSGYNQSAGGSVNYQGGPLTASLAVGVGFGSGANRYYESVVDELSVNYSLSASYLYSPKTTLTGNFSQSLTNPDGSFGATGSFNLGASALWQYSPLTQFGPGIRYSRETGDTQLDRTSIGPTMTVNYKLSRKVSLNSMVGLEFTEYEGGESTDPSVIAAISMNYQASSLWGMNLSLNRSTQASPSNAGEFDETTSLRVGYNRRIRRASWTLGMSYEIASSQAPDSVVIATTDDRNYLSLDTSLGMPVFADTCNASVFARYSDQSAGTGGNSWGSFQTGFSISRSF